MIHRYYRCIRLDFVNHSILLRRLSSDDPVKIYQKLVLCKKIVEDPIQKKAIDLLQLLYTELKAVSQTL